MSEYEKGLTIYKDVLVDDSIESGIDLSFSDLQCSRALSKSEEIMTHSSIFDASSTKSKASIDEISPASQTISDDDDDVFAFSSTCFNTKTPSVEFQCFRCIEEKKVNCLRLI